MNLTISISQSELERLVDIEVQLRELSQRVTELDNYKKFSPQPGNLVQFINLLGKAGAVYEVTSTTKG